MTKQTFPNIYKALSTDALRPAMNHAIIENGKIIATNGSLVIFSDFGNYVTNPEFAEGKVLDRDLLKWMTGKKFYQLECNPSGITGYSTTGMEEMPYPGYFEITETQDEDGKKHVTRPIYKDGQKTGNFPAWRSAIPNDEDFSKSEGLACFGLNMECLNIISGSFLFDSKSPVLKMEFSEKCRIVRISPKDEDYGVQQAILMTYIFEKHEKTA